jgi:membrane-bound serine protease (ClpP class)
VAAAVAAITLFLVGGVLRAHGGRVQTGDEGLLGILAEARTDFAGQGDRYVGKVFVRGEWWNAESDAPLAAGQECRVEGRQGLTLNVKSSGTGRT